MYTSITIVAINNAINALIVSSLPIDPLISVWDNNAESSNEYLSLSSLKKLATSSVSKFLPLTSIWVPFTFFETAFWEYFFNISSTSNLSNSLPISINTVVPPTKSIPILIPL